MVIVCEGYVTDRYLPVCLAMLMALPPIAFPTWLCVIRLGACLVLFVLVVP